MREIIMQYKEKAKRSLAFVLAVIMLCASMFGDFAGNVAQSAEPNNVPTNVEFESLKDVAGVESYQVGGWARANLGQLSSTDKGFKVSVPNPTKIATTDNNNKYIEIGLYNVESNNSRQGGFTLKLFKISSSEFKWELIASPYSNQTQVLGSGNITDITDEYLDIYVWMNGKNDSTRPKPKVNLVINGVSLLEDASQTNCETVEGRVGTYINVYNSMNLQGFTLLDIPSVGEDVLEIPSNVTFEDLGQIAEVNKVKAAKKTTVGLGEVSSEATGFKFWVTHPGSVEPNVAEKRYYLGLYNTKADPWKGGYILRINYISETALKWEVIANTVQNTAMVMETLASGQIKNISEDKIMVYAWLNGTDATTGNPLLNVIVHNKQVAKDITSTAHTVTAGKHMAVFNELSDMIEIETVTQLEEDNFEIPSNVTFEDLGQIAEVNKVKAAKRTTVGLGEVSSENVGFKFWVTQPGSVSITDAEKRYYLGLYNTKADPWKGGYVLRITYVAEDTLKWEVIANTVQNTAMVMETLASGQITDITEDKIMVYAWLNGTDATTGNPLLNVAVHNTQVAKDVTSKNHTVTVGKHMAVFNALSDMIEIETVTRLEEGVIELPSNVTFEDLGQTAEENLIKAAKRTTISLGKVANEANGFKFWMTNPGSTTPSDAEKRCYIGLYNTKADPWKGGYVLRLTYVAKDTLKWEVMANVVQSGKMTMVTIKSGQIIDILDDKIMVYAWLDGTDATTGNPLLNVIIHNKQVVKNATVKTDTVTIGRHMAFYNALCNAIEIETITKLPEPNHEIPSNVKFEDLGQTLAMNSLKALNKKSISLGQVSSENTGFKFWVTHPGKVQVSGEKRCYIGLYNTKADPWKGGYILRLTYVSEDTFKWEVLANTVQSGKMTMVAMRSGELSGISGDKIMVYAWLSGKDAVSGNPKLNLNVAGTRILTDKTTDDAPVTIGKYMSVHNVFGDTIVFETTKKVEFIPSNIEFEDIGDTLRENSVTAKFKKGASLGLVTTVKTGFVCKVPKPASLKTTGLEKRYYLGFYNTKSADPWRDGFMIRISHGSNKDAIRWEAFTKTMKLIASGEVGGITGNDVAVYVWLNGNDKETGNPILNAIIGDTRVLKDVVVSGEVMVTGRYMSVYNVLSEEMEITSYTRIVTMREKYMKRFGNVTDPDFIPTFDTSALEKLEQQDQNNTEEKKEPQAETIIDKITNSAIIKDIFGEDTESSAVLFALGATAVLLITAGAVTVVILVKRKKRAQSEQNKSANEE